MLIEDKLLVSEQFEGQSHQKESERSLPKIVECLEAPVATSSIVPMYSVIMSSLLPLR